MARTAVVTDNFNRASLGSDYAQLNTYIGGSVVIDGSIRVYGSTGATPPGGAAARYVGAGSFTDDQYAKIKIAAVGYNTTDYHIGVICRASADDDNAGSTMNRDFYWAVACSSGDGWGSVQFGKIAGGTPTTFYSSNLTLAVDYTLELQVEGTSTATIRLLLNGEVPNANYTYTDNSPLTTGLPGIMAAGNAPTTSSGDDFEAGNLTADVSGAAKMSFYRMLRNA